MITIKKLTEEGFFDKINEIKSIGSGLGIAEIYVTPPVISESCLHLMIIVNPNKSFSIENEIRFRDELESIFGERLNFHIFQKSEAEEAVQQDPILGNDYGNAMAKGVLIEELDKDTELNDQWRTLEPELISKNLRDNPVLTQPIKKQGVTEQSDNANNASASSNALTCYFDSQKSEGNGQQRNFIIDFANKANSSDIREVCSILEGLPAVKRYLQSLKEQEGSPKQQKITSNFNGYPGSVY